MKQFTDKELNHLISGTHDDLRHVIHAIKGAVDQLSVVPRDYVKNLDLINSLLAEWKSTREKLESYSDERSQRHRNRKAAKENA